MVHNLQDTTRSDILIEVYDILLDAVYSVQTDQMNTSIEDIEKVKNVLLKMKKQEEEEREKEQKSQNIESILDTL